MKKIAIIGGGTVSHVRAHMALCAPAYGNTAKNIFKQLSEKESVNPILYLTKMAGGKDLETNLDIKKLIVNLLLDEEIKVIVFNPALCDFDGQIGDEYSGKYSSRLKTREGEQIMKLTPADKVISLIKKARPDIFLIGFKTTNGDSEEEQYHRGVNLIKESNCDIVLANDLSTRNNLILKKDDSFDFVFKKEFSSMDRDQSINKLVSIIVDKT